MSYRQRLHGIGLLAKFCWKSIPKNRCTMSKWSVGILSNQSSLHIYTVYNSTLLLKMNFAMETYTTSTTDRLNSWLSITSQRGSAWHCYISHLISEGKCIFWPLGLKKPMNIFKTNLTAAFKSVRSTNLPNLVQIGCEMAHPHGGKI